MEKILVKHGNSLAIVIDKPICDLFDLKLGSKMDLQFEGQCLVLKNLKEGATEAKSERSKERKQLIDKIGRNITKKHSRAFKELAK